MAQISEQFIINILRDANVIIRLEYEIDYGDKMYDKISLKKAGRLFFDYQRMKNDIWNLKRDYIWPFKNGDWVIYKDLENNQCI